METRTGRFKLTGPIVTDYQLREGKDRLFLLLHGYSQSARFIYGKLAPLLPASAAVLALNGPFPIPDRTKDGYRVGFSWYFYDPATDDYFIDMEAGLETVARAVERLAPQDVPVTVIGYSQGGYLAPFVAQRLPRADRVIGIACEFLHEELGPLSAWEPGKRPGFRMDAIHGESDEVVGVEGARRSHGRFVEAGIPGEFVVLPGQGHRITEATGEALLRLLGR